MSTTKQETEASDELDYLTDEQLAEWAGYKLRGFVFFDIALACWLRAHAEQRRSTESANSWHKFFDGPLVWGTFPRAATIGSGSSADRRVECYHWYATRKEALLSIRRYLENQRYLGNASS